MGVGIWAMHFIGILAFNLPVFVAYDLVVTILSILPAIIGSSVFLILLTKESHTKIHFYISSFCFAIGVGAMHFIGMEAMKAEAIMRYQPGAIIFVIIFALLLATLSLYTVFYQCKGKNFVFGLGSSLIMALAISAIHYSGMNATSFYALPAYTPLLHDELFTHSQLSVLIAVGTGLLISILYIATKISERFNRLSPHSSDYIRAIVDNSADAIITINIHSLILSFNKTAETLFGYRKEEITGKNISLLMPKGLRPVHDGYVKNSILHGPRVFNLPRDLMALKRDGTLFPIELNVSPMDIGGEKIFIGILRDISKRKEQDRLLAESQARYQQLTQLSSDWIWETDSDHKISYLSDSFQLMTGIPLQSFVGKKRDSLTIYDLSDNDWTEYTKILAEKFTLKNFKFTLKNVDGDLKYLMINGSPVINNDGVFVGYRGTGSDVTEITQAKKDAEKANKAKSHFLSSMSHELRTPLNAILGFSQLMADDPSEPLTENQIDSVHYILKSGKHLLTLINDILDLSKIESGNIELSIEPLLLNTVLDECTSLIRPFAETHEISISQQNRPDDNLQIAADYTRIKQVILNLLSNAIKYNSKRGTVTLNYDRVENNKLRIIIKDAGTGIPKEKQDKLFSPFERLGAENSDIEGTGIGLVVCKELMGKMHGSIGFKSEEGLGSSFWAEIPLAGKNTHINTMGSTSDDTQTNDKNVSGTILYVEDNPANIHLVERIVARFPDLELVSAHTAELGISIACSKNISLVLMDINLPGINGIEALQELKANPKTQSMPIVAVSAEATKRDVKRGLDAGFNHYLSKPFNLLDMQEIIERYCIKNKNHHKT